MTTNDHRNRVLAAVAACRPLSKTGAFLLERYMQVADTPANTWPPRERHYVYELCRLVEQNDFAVLTIAGLRKAALANGLSGRARLQRSSVVGRLIRILQTSGELPTQRDLRNRQATRRLLTSVPSASRRFLGKWELARRDVLGPHELRHEIRRLTLLEHLAVHYPDAADEYLLDRWLRLLVRQIVDCRCAPVTRARDPFTCCCCGRTAATAGTRPSPARPKQKEITRIGARYLEFRRVARWLEAAA